MDIHAPSGPTHSFKDFAIHILIVTIGILIAFGLEGARESWREDKAVSETRHSLQKELRINQEKLGHELEEVKKTNTELDRILAHLPELAKTPAALRTQGLNLFLPGYFFRTTGWDSALASGVLTHMDNDELHRFDEAYLSVKNYQELQKWALPDLVSVRAYFGSHRSYSPAELTVGEQELRSLKIKTDILENVGEQFEDSLKDAIGDAHNDSH